MGPHARSPPWPSKNSKAHPGLGEIRATRQAWASRRGPPAQAPGGPWGRLTCRQGPGGGQCWHVLEQGDAQRPRGEGTGASVAGAGLVPSLRMSSDQAKAHLSHVGCDLAPREAPPSSALHPRRRPPPTASGAGLRTPVSGRSPATSLPCAPARPAEGSRKRPPGDGRTGSGA